MYHISNVSQVLARPEASASQKWGGVHLCAHSSGTSGPTCLTVLSVCKVRSLQARSCIDSSFATKLFCRPSYYLLCRYCACSQAAVTTLWGMPLAPLLSVIWATFHLRWRSSWETEAQWAFMEVFLYSTLRFIFCTHSRTITSCYSCKWCSKTPPIGWDELEMYWKAKYF